MANPEHVEILRQGTEIWNRWREENRGIDIDLRRTDLFEANLSGANLSEASLGRANLRRAYLFSADLRRTDLLSANLWNANLGQTIIKQANLSEANLSEANLRGADLNETNLFDTNLRRTRIGYTVFANIDLSGVKGLETVQHDYPSTIGIDTLEKSGGNIPISFLRGAGVSENLITYARSLVTNPIEYFTCFISYSSKDYLFVKRLYSDLQNEGVRCWLDREDLKIGDKWRDRIDEAIRMYDKLLLVLSSNSVESEWVEREVEAAFEKERRTNQLVLFPIRLDEAVMEVDVAWAGDIRRRRHIGDFTCWLDPLQNKNSFDRLVRDLQGAKDRKE